MSMPATGKHQVLPETAVSEPPPPYNDLEMGPEVRAQTDESAPPAFTEIRPRGPISGAIAYLCGLSAVFSLFAIFMSWLGVIALVWMTLCTITLGFSFTFALLYIVDAFLPGLSMRLPGLRVAIGNYWPFYRSGLMGAAVLGTACGIVAALAFVVFCIYTGKLSYASVMRRERMTSPDLKSARGFARNVRWMAVVLRVLAVFANVSVLPIGAFTLAWLYSVDPAEDLVLRNIWSGIAINLMGAGVWHAIQWARHRGKVESVHLAEGEASEAV